MLDFQMKQTSFRYGIAEGDDPHAVPFGVLTTLENYVWTKTNRVQKRAGNDFQGYGIVGGGTLSALGVRRMFTRNFGKELCVVNGTSLYSYAPATAAWTLVASVPDVGLTQTPLIDPNLGVAASDTGLSAANQVVSAFINGDPTTGTASGGFSVCVTELTTGALLMPVTIVTAASVARYVRVCVIGAIAVIVVSGTDASIRAYTVDLTTYAVSGATVLRADRTNTAVNNWDAKVITGTSFFVLSYKSAAGLNLYSYDTAFAVQANATQATADVPAFLSVDATIGESIYVAYFQGTGLVRCYVADPTTMVTTVVPFTVEDVVATGGNNAYSVAVCRYDAASAIVAYTRNEAVTVNIPSLTSKNVTSAGVVTVATRRCTQGVYLTSTPFVVGGKCYAFGTIAALAGTVFTGRIFSGNSCCLFNLFPGPDSGVSPISPTHQYVGCGDTLLGAINSFGSGLPRFHVVSANRVVGGLSFIGTAPSNARSWRCGLRLLDITAADLAPNDLWRPVSRGADTFFAGSVLSVYDGGDVFDYGFPYAPFLADQVTAAAGGVILAGVYFYASHLEYRSASGLLHRGPTTTGPLITTTGATSKNTLKFANVNVGNKVHPQVERFTTSLPVYRTVANGSIPQRLTEEPSFNLLPVTYANGEQSFVDTKSDLAIDTDATLLSVRPAIYTSGGTLDDQAPPSNITMFSHVDRLFVLAGDKRTWWYSKSFNDDLGVAPGFNVAFRISMPTEQVAGESMDDKAIFFGPSGVSYMLGTGPAKDGTNSDFTTPVKIQTDVGCINARSVVSMPDGIMFQSLRGIYILSRSLELVWIGRPVQDTLAAYPNITSAVLVPGKNEIRFTANNLANNLGVVMVYNYVEKQWSTSKYYDRVLTGQYGCAIADACMWNGAWTFVTPAGIVYKESELHHFDGSDTYVVGIIETAWNSAAGPIAYQAVRNFWLQGFSNTDHDLTISIAFDSNNTYLQTKTFPALSPVTKVGDIEEAKISVGTRRKCNSIRFKVTDSAPSTPGSVLGTFATVGGGRGPTFQTMGYEVGIKKGDNMGQGKKG